MDTKIRIEVSKEVSYGYHMTCDKDSDPQKAKEHKNMVAGIFGGLLKSLTGLK